MALGAAAAAAVAAWAAAHLELDGPATAALLLAAAIPGAGYGRRVAGPFAPVEVRWDGQVWHLDGERGTCAVMLDLQRWLLLRFRAAGRGASRWVAVSCAGRDARLHALRSALYSSSPSLDDRPRVRTPDGADD
ncbi:MAG: hypothetical protein JNL85_18270 [Rubrivivax sp.]|nr:hypothetical protein [Rubrivivax sp.]